MSCNRLWSYHTNHKLSYNYKKLINRNAFWNNIFNFGTFNVINNTQPFEELIVTRFIYHKICVNYNLVTMLLQTIKSHRFRNYFYKFRVTTTNCWWSVFRIPQYNGYLHNFQSYNRDEILSNESTWKFLEQIVIYYFNKPWESLSYIYSCNETTLILHLFVCIVIKKKFHKSGYFFYFFFNDIMKYDAEVK